MMIYCFVCTYHTIPYILYHTIPYHTIPYHTQSTRYEESDDLDDVDDDDVYHNAHHEAEEEDEELGDLPAARGPNPLGQ